MPEENEVIDSPTDTEATSEETVESTETTEETPEVDVEKLQATNKKLFERAKKAEEALKAAKTSKTPEAKVASPQSQSVEETVLLANGMPEELLGELKAVAKARGIDSLVKAQNDSIFVAVKEKFEKDKKQAEASLPASRGSGNVKARKDFKTPGLSREEHKAMVESQR